MSNTPSDAELGQLAEECGIGWAAGLGGMDDFLRAFSSAVLAKWGTPAPVGVEPIGWNPLDNDADALRLAVKLNLRVMPQEKCVYVESNPDSVLGFASVSEMEMNGDDPYAATRRAIVRAAAEIVRAAAEIRKSL